MMHIATYLLPGYFTMPATRLTKRIVESTQPTSNDVILMDTDLTGFGLKVTPKGRRSYFLYYRTKSGTQRRPNIGQHGPLTCEQAREIAKDWLADVAKGGDPSQDRKSTRLAPTVAEVCQRFMDEHSGPRNKGGTAYNYQRLIDRFIIPALGTRKITEITRPDVEKLHRDLRKTPYQANRLLGLISKIMNMAEYWGYRAEHTNPTHRVQKYPESKRQRYLSGEEIASLAATLNEAEQTQSEPGPVIAAIRLLLLTGCRMSEILTLRWEHVDFDQGWLALPDSKTGAKHVHLNGAALDVLQALVREPDNPHVIPGAVPGQHLVNLEKPWRRIRKKAGLEDVRLHDLRHTYASIAAGLGQGLHMIGQLLGHSQAATTHRYAHLAADPIKAATDEIGAKISGLMGQPSG
jgi:integrase